MPLTAPVERELLHSRDIVLRGYRREDRLFDIEAQLTDTKTRGFANEDRGWVEAGEPLHGMWMRLTLDEDLTIIACEAAIDYSPYAVCPAAAPNFSRLAGLRIKPGFLREAMSRVGGTQGCTHLRELLQQMGTTAYQSVFTVREQRKSEAKAGKKPAIIDTCLAYASDGPVVQRNWPQFFTGDQPQTTEEQVTG
jgi:hypothetical protein